MPPAETLCEIDLLSRIYQRQFLELEPLRRHILSLLPLNRVNTIFEPGCGTGLLGRQLQSLTDADYKGMDISKGILPPGNSFIKGDAEKNHPPADLYVTGFFFSSLKDPVKWLSKLKAEVFAVFGEYDYQSINEQPVMNIAGRLRAGLVKSGLSVTRGASLNSYFERSGFVKLHGGEVRSMLQKPDREFLSMHIPDLEEELPLMSWRIVWGIWRRRAE